LPVLLQVVITGHISIEYAVTFRHIVSL